MKIKPILPVLKRSFADWNQDNCPRLGAALAFYTLLSISPLLILVMDLISIIFNRGDAQAKLLAQVQSVIGPSGKDAVQAILASGHSKSSTVVGAVLGIVTLLFGASGVFGELRSALNMIWEAKPKNASGVWGFLRERFFSFGMVLSVGFVLLVSLLVSTGLDAMTKFFSGLFPIPPSILEIFNFVISFLAIAILFAFIFKFVPEAPVAWGDVRIGALATALLFTIGKSLLGLYLGKTSPGSAYGAAGSLVVLVMWIYYSAQIFFFGAEFTHVYALSLRPEWQKSKSKQKSGTEASN